MRKYNYNYEIITKDGEKITQIDQELLATRTSRAKKILKLRFPSCVIMDCRTLSPKNYYSSMSYLNT